MIMKHKGWYSETIETKEQFIQLLNHLSEYLKNSGQNPLFRGQIEADWMITSTYYREFAKKFELKSITTFGELTAYMEEDTNSNIPYSQQHDLMIKIH